MKKNIQQIVDLMLRTVVIFVTTTLGERIEQKKNLHRNWKTMKFGRNEGKKKANKSLVTVLVGIMLELD